MRYLPLTKQDRDEMCRQIGIENPLQLFDVIPQKAREKAKFNLPNQKSEIAVENHMQLLAQKNLNAGKTAFFVGAGAYRHHVPASVDAIIQRSEFLTAYTPYQAEIAQGTLQYMFEFQTQTARILEMDISNASLYDGSTAASEAAMAAFRITGKSKIIISGNLHPHYRQTVENIVKMSDNQYQVTQSQINQSQINQSQINQAIPEENENIENYIDENTAAVIVQNPDVFGNLNDFSKLAETLHKNNALLIVCVTEIVSLGLIKSPGEMDADIAVAEGQSIGNSLNFGGPYLGLFATKKKYMRQIPGRLCGKTVDTDGKDGYVLTLTAREQHIRRQKATSNICTSSGLCALAFCVHMTLLGSKGFKKLAAINHAKAVKLAKEIARIDNVQIINHSFFNEFTIKVPGDAEKIVEKMAQKNVIAGVPAKRLFPENEHCKDKIITAVTELNTENDFDLFVETLKNTI